MKRLSSLFVYLVFVCMLFSSGLRAQATGVTPGLKAADVKARLGEPLEEFGSLMRFGPCADAEGGAKWGFVFLPDLPGAEETTGPRGGTLTAISRYACGGELLDDATFRKEVTAVMPADAKLVREFQTEDGRSASEYVSSWLASQFPADAFVTCDAEGRVLPATPGTLSIALAADGLSWFLGLGSCL